MIREQLPDAYEVEFVASELVTNVIRHAKTEFVVSVDVDETTVRIEVMNHSGIMPAFRELTQGSNSPVGGAGLHVVEAISERWGVEPLPDGKVVWADIRRGHDGNEDLRPSDTNDKETVR